MMQQAFEHAGTDECTAEMKKEAFVSGSLDDLLAGFQCHLLKESGDLELMKRFDTKYLMPRDKLPVLLEILRDDYSILSINDKKLMRYKNIYFDSERFSFYRQHHDRMKRRSKIRFRTYMDSGTSFLEIKNKHNDNMTDKKRIAVNADEVVSLLQRRKLPPFRLDEPVGNLSARVTIYYQRLSLLSKKHQERVSIDLELRAEREDSSSTLVLYDLAVVEVKQGKINRESPLCKAMRSMGCRAQPFSKYCIACAFLYPDIVRSNTFKPVIRNLSPHLQILKGSDFHV